MAVTPSPVFLQGVNLGLVTIVPADTTTSKTVFTAGANGSKIEALFASSTDTSNRDVTISITRSATNYLLATVQLPLNAGNTNAIASVDLLRSTMLPGLSFDALGNRAIYLKSGDTLTVACTTTVTAAKTLTFTAVGADL